MAPERANRPRDSGRRRKHWTRKDVRTASQEGRGGERADKERAGYAARRGGYAWDGSRRLGGRGGDRSKRAWSTSALRRAGGGAEGTGGHKGS